MIRFGNSLKKVQEKNTNWLW